MGASIGDPRDLAAFRESDLATRKSLLLALAPFTGLVADPSAEGHEGIAALHAWWSGHVGHKTDWLDLGVLKPEYSLELNGGEGPELVVAEEWSTSDYNFTYAFGTADADPRVTASLPLTDGPAIPLSELLLRCAFVEAAERASLTLVIEADDAGTVTLLADFIDVPLNGWIARGERQGWAVGQEMLAERRSDEASSRRARVRISALTSDAALALLARASHAFRWTGQAMRWRTRWAGGRLYWPEPGPFPRLVLRRPCAELRSAVDALVGVPTAG